MHLFFVETKIETCQHYTAKGAHGYELSNTNLEKGYKK